MAAGNLFVVATPIGNLRDLSPRALEVLRSADLIAAEDTRHTLKLLTHFDVKARLISYHKFNEEEQSEKILDAIQVERKNVALVSDAGTPGISDPGYLLVKRARERGIPVFGIPGPSAAIAALSISGLPAMRFVFHGFPPETGAKRRDYVRRLRASEVRTHVFYESPRRILALMEVIEEEYPNARVCVCSELTKFFERSDTGPIAEVVQRLKENPNLERGEYTVVLTLDEAKKPDADTDETGASSLEARLVEMMVRRQVSLREAVSLLVKEQELPKNRVYQASLELRRMWEQGSEES